MLACATWAFRWKTLSSTIVLYLCFSETWTLVKGRTVSTKTPSAAGKGWRPRRHSRTFDGIFGRAAETEQQNAGRCMGTPNWPRHNESWDHIVWLGDSLTRYQYLQLVYQVDREMEGDGGDFLLNEKTYSSWTDFLRHSSEGTFPGRMTCDCWRDEPGGRGDLVNSRVAKWKENRYYFKRRGDGQKNVVLSFYWWPGDGPLQGSIDAGEECNAKLVPDTQPPPEEKWQVSARDFFPDVLAKVSPQPTRIVLNNGLWNPVTVTDDIINIIHAADRVAPGEVYWKETSPLAGSVKDPKPIDRKVQALCHSGEGRCTYIPFPGFPPRLLTGGNLHRWDGMHFADAETYKCWTRAVLEAMRALDVLPKSEMKGSGQKFGDPENTCSFVSQN